MRIQADALLVRAQRILRSHRQLAKKDGATLDYGLDEVQELLKCCTCAYCLLPIGWDAQVDHATPLARGGRHSIENLCLACIRCNQLKGQLTVEEFFALLKLLRVYPEARADIERRLLAGSKIYRKN